MIFRGGHVDAEKGACAKAYLAGKGEPFRQPDDIHILVSKLHFVVEILCGVIKHDVPALGRIHDLRLEPDLVVLQPVFVIDAHMPSIAARFLYLIVDKIRFAQYDGG